MISSTEPGEQKDIQLVRAKDILYEDPDDGLEESESYGPEEYVMKDFIYIATRAEALKQLLLVLKDLRDARG